MSFSNDRLKELQNCSYNYYGEGENIATRSPKLTEKQSDLDNQVNNFLNVVIPIKDRIKRLTACLDQLKHVYNAIVNPSVHDDEVLQKLEYFDSHVKYLFTNLMRQPVRK